MIKNILLKFIGMSLIFLLVLTGCGNQTTEGNTSKSEGSNSESDQIQERSLRLAHLTATEDPTHDAAQLFADRVNELSNGKIEIQIYPNNQLGTPEEIAEQVRLGTIDMSISSAGQIQLWTPEFAAIQLPFLFDSREHVYNVLDGEGGEQLAKLAREDGFEVISHWELGFRVISNNVRPIESVEDMVGLDLRVPPEVPMESAMRALGAVPQQIAWSEVYMSLNQGVVDGQENPLHFIYTNALHEVQDYITVPGAGYMYASYPHVMNSDLWSNMSTEEQEIIQTASIEARELSRDLIAEATEESAELMEQEGVEISYIDAEPFREKMEPAWDEIAEYAGEEFVPTWIELVEESK